MQWRRKTAVTGGTVGVSHVYPNRDVLKDCHVRGGGHVPLVPPWFRHLWNDQSLDSISRVGLDTPIMHYKKLSIKIEKDSYR